ncbi:MAG: flavin reductase family protein [Pseudomonadota bacterium]|nr:flavin reductase family protein [Pseudomonadota bacterium]
MTENLTHDAAAFSTDDFRRCLGEYGTGVSVITTQHGGQVYGMTSNSFASVSLDPPLVLWSIRRESTSFDAFAASAHFTVNILSDTQVALSQRFAKSGGDKFDGVDWREGAGGAPVLTGAVASFQCRKHDSFDGGDHVILVGQVLSFDRQPRQPLLFSKGRYAVAMDHPDTRVFAAPDEPETAPINEQLLSLMLVRAYSVVAKRLEDGRRTAGLGLSLMQARLLKAIQMFPDRTLEDLLPEVLGDIESALVNLSALESEGLARVDGSGRIRLTSPGMARLHALLDHTRDSERMLFQTISDADLETVQRVLARIVEADGASA